MIKGIVASEMHASGKWHFHALLVFAEKLQFRKQDCFDIPCFKCGKHHPNIQGRPQKAREKWENQKYEYCRKEDTNPLIVGNFLPTFFKSSAGFTKKKMDYDNWLAARMAMTLKEVKEFKLPYNPGLPINIYEIPTLQSRKKVLRERLLIFHGEPGCGKTKWVQDTFDGMKAYMRGSNGFPYEKLSDESVIIWDDLPLDTPNLVEEIIDVLNINRVRTHVYGKARYAPVYYPVNSIRVIIWIMNTDRLVNWEHVWKDPRIVSRTAMRVKVVKSPDLEDEVEDMSDSEAELRKEGPLVVD